MNNESGETWETVNTFSFPCFEMRAEIWWFQASGVTQKSFIKHITLHFNNI